MASKKQTAKNGKSRHQAKNPKPFTMISARKHSGSFHQTSNWSGKSSLNLHARSKAGDLSYPVTEKIHTSNFYAPLADWHLEKEEHTKGKTC